MKGPHSSADIKARLDASHVDGIVIHVLVSTTTTVKIFTLNDMGKTGVNVIDGDSGATSDGWLLILTGKADTDVWLIWPSMEYIALREVSKGANLAVSRDTLKMTPSILLMASST